MSRIAGVAVLQEAMCLFGPIPLVSSAFCAPGNLYVHNIHS